jgi:hypothetical protein
MATIKGTNTLGAETVRRMADAAQRLAKQKSEIVRGAVADYHGRMVRLSESERRRMLKVFDTMLPRTPSRPRGEVDAELCEIRRERHSSGRLSASRKRNQE